MVIREPLIFDRGMTSGEGGEFRVRQLLASDAQKVCQNPFIPYTRVE
jgi:hypothetical protein